MKVVVKQDTAPVNVVADITSPVNVTVKQDAPINIVSDNSTPTASVKVVERGPEGPPGPQGEKGEPGLSLISMAGDVDAGNLKNGSLLVFKTETNKWTATTQMEDQFIEGGHF